ncbi:bacilysin biosynthesis protein BacC [Bacillus freudenreichii]|nr:bacilysin biosynthesis protein BacC [Bacillus freudenreichii]
MLQSLQGKTVLVTGAASGIGRATARKFAQLGCRLVLNDINEDALLKVKEMLPNSDEHQLLTGDISKEATAERFVQTALNHFGRIDILVNNAGVHCIQDIEETTVEDFDRVFDINLKSMFLCCKHVIPVMRTQEKGVIINLSSISAYIGQEMMGKSTFLYNMTKAGALQLTRSLATRYAQDGIRVNCVAPGATKTSQITEEMAPDLEAFWVAVGEAHPLKRVGEPEEIAKSIVFLASDDASFITGSSLIVDGGYLVQ